MLAKVGEGACCTLEVSAGDLHALGGKTGRMARGRARPLPVATPKGRGSVQPWSLRTVSSPPQLSRPRPLPAPYLLRHPLVHGPQHGVQCPWGGRGHGVRASLGLLPRLPAPVSMVRQRGQCCHPGPEKQGSENWGSWSRTPKLEQTEKLRSPTKALSLLLSTRQGCRERKRGSCLQPRGPVLKLRDAYTGL